MERISDRGSLCPVAVSTRAAGPGLAPPARAGARARPALQLGERPAPGPGPGLGRGGSIPGCHAPPVLTASAWQGTQVWAITAVPARAPSHSARTAGPLSVPRRAGAGGGAASFPYAARSPQRRASGCCLRPTSLAAWDAARGLAAGGGGGASRPSDHLWKRSR